MKPLLSIMVLEDCDEDFDTLQDAARLAKLPHSIVRAGSGKECLCLLLDKTLNREAFPKLILMDLNMSGEDGRKTLIDIRNHDALKTLPIIVLSTSSNTIDLNYCYANGANAYHVKPLDYNRHLQLLQQIFTYWLHSVTLHF
jgi:CheY-like chemotaxis protein